MSKKLKLVILFVAVIAIGWGIGKYAAPSASPEAGGAVTQQEDLQSGLEATPVPGDTVGGEEGTPDTSGSDGVSASAAPASPAPAEPVSGGVAAVQGENGELTAAEPDSVTVIVNKQYRLPENYRPDDLVYPEVPFTFKEKIEKRMMRKEAAEALADMFDGAKKDGIYLAGVSAFRSQKTQTGLFNRYVERDGEEKARTYSAVPGYSEHQTGLSIDVSGSDGKCAAESCFGGTPEAEWLAAHAQEYGYIIRYPDGKEAITGYMYEPWHIRYVGKDIAASIHERGITLEEYYDAVPVSK